ncbi:FAD-dependent oxidoreductase [Metallumcola ferriviriculae]|uniref:FAD-dependent oxidoreductase n=1 Tax=Metallumcola ferriviriculae TaxID=3039180 RepID=A0AAU0UMR8_9FIRM|nr:FAD-dependent oxidoreductase [Desulfitibacteraceae bacterium MK1]
MSDKFDVIIVGAGPSGLAAGYMLAKEGMDVIIVERGDHPGTKNVMGGVLYRQPTEEIIPKFWEKAPVERAIVEQRMWLVDKESVVTLGHRSKGFGTEPYNNFTVLRAKFDRWFAEQVVDAGALLITETVVEDFLYDGSRIVGVKTGREQGDIRANVIILAEGVNSLLAQKVGLQRDGINSSELAVAVKEIITLPKEKIEDRFNLEEGEGATIELVGDSTFGMMGTGFIYTNKDSLSVGCGVLVSQLVEHEGLNPNEILEHMKSHPAVKPLLQGGESNEYLAHMIPEGGYRAMPKLYRDNVLVVGDAAMLCNGIHREGSNMALTSGKFAAETVIAAHQRGDYSAGMLSEYQSKLEKSFVLKDLKKYQNVGVVMERNRHFFSFYPHAVNAALEEFLTVDSVPKKEKQQRIWNEVTSQRSKYEIIKDLYRGWRVMG